MLPQHGHHIIETIISRSASFGVVGTSAAVESLSIGEPAQNSTNPPGDLNEKEQQLEEERISSEITNTHLKELGDFSSKLNEAPKNILKKK